MARKRTEKPHAEIAKLDPQRLAVNPASGEVVNLDGATDELGRALLEVRELEGMLRSYKARIGEEILGRMDREGVWTANLPGLKITGSSPDRVVYDGEALRDELARLVRSGEITVEAAGRCVEVVTTYKPSARHLKALRKIGGTVAEAIDRHTRRDDSPRRVSVSVDLETEGRR